jgi:hypothetical protein
VGDPNDLSFPCEVEFYSGHKGEETPLAVRIGGRKIMITRVLSRERILDAVSQELNDVFLCASPQGRLSLSLNKNGEAECRFKTGANRKI